MITKENATTLKLFLTKISKDIKQKIHVPILKKSVNHWQKLQCYAHSQYFMLGTIMCGIVLHISNLKFTPCSKAFSDNAMF